MNAMDMFTCKVVNIIQEIILQAYVIYCILFYYQYGMIFMVFE